MGGQVAAALMAQAPELLAQPPVIEAVDVLAAKLPEQLPELGGTNRAVPAIGHLQPDRGTDELVLKADAFADERVSWGPCVNLSGACS